MEINQSMNRQLTFITLASLTLCGTAIASTDDITAANNQIGVQGISTKLDYTENGGSYGSQGGVLDTENGTVNGFALTASVMQDVIFGNDYFQLKYSHNSGNTDYVGSYIGSGQGYGSVRASSTATMNDYSAAYGKGFELTKQLMLTPYVEFGHHKWERGLGDGNNETYSHSFYDVGAMLQYSPIQQLVISGKLYTGHTLNSDISSTSTTFSGASLGNSSLNGYGLSVDYAFTKEFHANLGYEHSEFKYGYSSVNNLGYYEPDSTTKNNTYSIGIGYAF